MFVKLNTPLLACNWIPISVYENFDFNDKSRFCGKQSYSSQLICQINGFYAKILELVSRPVSYCLHFIHCFLNVRIEWLLLFRHTLMCRPFRQIEFVKQTSFSVETIAVSTFRSPIMALFQMERYKITRFEQYKTDVEQCVQSNNDRMSLLLVWNCGKTRNPLRQVFRDCPRKLSSPRHYVHFRPKIHRTNSFFRYAHVARLCIRLGLCRDPVPATRQRESTGVPAAAREAHSTWECFFFRKLKPIAITNFGRPHSRRQHCHV